MLRVDEMDVAWPTGDQVANIMQDPLTRPTAETGLATARTMPMGEVPRAPNDVGLGQIFGSRDAFRGIGYVPSGSRHGKALLGQVFQPKNLRDLLVSVMADCLF